MILNRFKGKEIKPTRALGHVDSLNPYLLILYKEGFFRLLTLAKKNEFIGAIKQGKVELAITHLFFADDSTQFDKATMKRVTSIKKVIGEYEKNVWTISQI